LGDGGAEVGEGQAEGVDVGFVGFARGVADVAGQLAGDGFAFVIGGGDGPAGDEFHGAAEGAVEADDLHLDEVAGAFHGAQGGDFDVGVGAGAGDGAGEYFRGEDVEGHAPAVEGIGLDFMVGEAGDDLGPVEVGGQAHGGEAEG